MMEKISRKALTALIGLFCKPAKLSLKESERELREHPPKKILVIRQHHKLGDTLLSTPCLRALRQNFPSADIDFIASSYNQKTVSNNPDLSRVIIYEKKKMWNPLYLWRFMRFIRHPQYDVCFILSTVCVSLTNALLAWMSGSKLIVGYDTHSYGTKDSQVFYHVEIPITGKDVREVDKNLGILESVGIYTNKKELVFKQFYGDDKYAESLLADQNKPFIGIQNGGSYAHKRWTAQSYADVANELIRKTKYQLVLFYAPGQENLAEETRKLLISEPIEIKDVNFSQTAAILKRLDFFITNDSGIMHLAAAVGTQTLALFFETDPNIWMPYGKHIFFLKDERQKPLKTSQVVEKSLKILKSSRK